ncbi:solute carrier family 2, facilitated glucose transporter member 3-like isoform X2 [Harmonia axyridis]|uniref:solute carrier family 2, facilitated glucose transporter member 3-like isoform X2 n=1 Tax=Harmonia axyridis TaxID=115357 RepID=UPI001E279364|nr:solute carrier family 2, facilitated glucose transporter member 3-like isoform X2 [Harmonia axyridis]
MVGYHFHFRLGRNDWSSSRLLSRFCGLKWSLILNNILVIISAVLVFASKLTAIYELLIVARFVLGLNSGLFAGLCPMYLNEISPVAKRGAIASVYQLVITISILVAQLLSYEKVLGSSSLWPYLLGGVILIPCVFQCLTMPFCPESPRYLLIIKKNQDGAQKSLKWLRNTDNNNEEISDMQKEAAAQEAAGSVTWKAMFTKNSLRTPLIISLMIMLAQQLCGINAIIVYSNDIFRNAGLDEFWSALGTVIIGIVNVMMTIVSLVLVDLLGRKTLLVIGFSGTTIFMTLLAVSIKFSEEYTAMGVLCIIFVIGFIISFATGPGSVPWFLVTELFKQDARPKATSLAVFTNWFANTIVMLTFLPIKFYLGYFVFIIFIVFQVLFLIFIIFKVPETKNKTIEEITALYKD